MYMGVMFYFLEILYLFMVYVLGEVEGGGWGVTPPSLLRLDTKRMGKGA
jgi:hypothetical protein